MKRRARHDLPQLLTIVTLVAASTVLGLIGPGLVLDTLDEGARQAVASAGSTADVVASVTVGEPRPGARLTTAPAMIGLGDTIPTELPEGLASVYTSSTLTVLSGETAVRAVDDAPWTGDGVLSLQIAMLTDANTAALTLVDGRLPAARDITSIDPVEVVLSPEAAAAAKVAIGDELALGVAPQETEDSKEPQPEPTVIVVGLVQTTDPDNALWVDSPELWTPRQRAASSAYQANTRVTVLAAADGVVAAGRFLDYPFNGFVRMTVDPDRFTEPLVSTVVAEAAKLRSNGQLLAPDSVASIGVQTAIPEALADYPLLADWFDEHLRGIRP